MKSQGRKAEIPCPVCNSKHRIVLDSRSKPNGGEPFIRRRIQCANGHRYSTYERPAWAWEKHDHMQSLIDELKALVKRL